MSHLSNMKKEKMHKKVIVQAPDEDNFVIVND